MTGKQRVSNLNELCSSSSHPENIPFSASLPLFWCSLFGNTCPEGTQHIDFNQCLNWSLLQIYSIYLCQNME